MALEKDKNIFEKEISQHQFHHLYKRLNYHGYKKFHYGGASIKKIDLSLFESYALNDKFDGFSLTGCISTYAKKLLWIAEYLALKNIYFDIFSALALHEGGEKVGEKFLTKVVKCYVSDILPEFDTKELLSYAINDLSNCYIEEDESYSGLGENVLIKEIEIGGAITGNKNFLQLKKNYIFLSKLFKFLIQVPHQPQNSTEYRYKLRRERRLHKILLGKINGNQSYSKLSMKDLY